MAYTFEKKILAESELKQAKLLGPAERATEKPNTGVTILKKSAYFVIRDCAKIAKQYLVLTIYGDFKNPIERLEGKFKREDIADFVNRSKRDLATSQLLSLILSDINKRKALENAKNTSKKPVKVEPVLDFTEYEEEDIYGEYDIIDEDTVEVPELTPEEPESRGTVDILCDAFKATE